MAADREEELLKKYQKGTLTEEEVEELKGILEKKLQYVIEKRDAFELVALSMVFQGLFMYKVMLDYEKKMKELEQVHKKVEEKEHDKDGRRKGN